MRKVVPINETPTFAVGDVPVRKLEPGEFNPLRSYMPDYVQDRSLFGRSILVFWFPNQCGVGYNFNDGHFYLFGCDHQMKTEWVEMHTRKDTCRKCGFSQKYDTSD